MPSVRENIVTAIADAMEKLDLGGNPRQRVQKVTQEWVGSELEGELPIIVVLDPSEENIPGGSGGAPLNHYLNNLEVIVFVILDAGNRDEPRARTMRRALAAVQKKLLEESVPDSGTIKAVNGVNWHHLNGNRLVEFGAGGNVVAVQLDTRTQYLFRDTDPNLGRG